MVNNTHNKNHTQPGYILLLTLLLLSLSVLLVTQLFYRGSAHVFLDDAMNSRQKAQVLALSVLDVAQSQLALVVTDTTVDAKKDRTMLLQKLLPVLNTWNSVALKKDVDGIDAQISYMISSEDGKVNINQLFDFSKKDFKSKEAKSFVQLLFSRLKPMVQGVDLFPAFEKFLKGRGYPLDDISDVFASTEFKTAFGNRQFPEPENQKDAVTLFDIFTVFAPRPTVSAWDASSSLVALAGLRAPSERANLAKELMKKVDVDQKELKTLWDSSLKKWYGKEYKDIPKGMELFFGSRFEPLFFSVTCSAQVGSITQNLYAIIGREFDEKKGHAELSIKKLYWI